MSCTNIVLVICLVAFVRTYRPPAMLVEPPALLHEHVDEAGRVMNLPSNTVVRYYRNPYSNMLVYAGREEDGGANVFRVPANLDPDNIVVYYWAAACHTGGYDCSNTQSHGSGLAARHVYGMLNSAMIAGVITGERYCDILHQGIMSAASRMTGGRTVARALVEASGSTLDIGTNEVKIVSEGCSTSLGIGSAAVDRFRQLAGNSV